MKAAAQVVKNRKYQNHQFVVKAKIEGKKRVCSTDQARVRHVFGTEAAAPAARIRQSKITKNVVTVVCNCECHGKSPYLRCPAGRGFRGFRPTTCDHPATLPRRRRAVTTRKSNNRTVWPRGGVAGVAGAQ